MKLVKRTSIISINYNVVADHAQQINRSIQYHPDSAVCRVESVSPIEGKGIDMASGTKSNIVVNRATGETPYQKKRAN